MRPRQWIKNLLVVAVPLAAGELFQLEVAFRTLAAGIAFCLVSSAVYLVNDSADVASDRLHPLKRHRPIAAGELSVRVALWAAAVLALAGLAIGLVCGWSLTLILVGYLLLQGCYSLWLKHEPVLDISVVTSGFVLRAVAGGAATGLPASQWFLLVAGFGSLFIVSGKRYSEWHTVGSQAGTRKSLVRYTDTYLRFVWSVAAAATLLSYALWAFEHGGDGALSWTTISIAPFVLGVLRYAVDIDAGTAAAPEDIIWHDRVLQSIGVVWILTATLGVVGA